MFYEEGTDFKALNDLHHKLKTAWCIESCSSSLRDQWYNSNPATGQCFVTALIVQDYFGGDVYELHLPQGAIHYYNVIQGKIVDLTSEQFVFHINSDFYSSGMKTDRAYRLKDPIKLERYLILKERVKSGRD